MKKPPPGATFITEDRNRSQYLREVLARLRNDVGTIFEAIEAHNRGSEQKIGFWAALRLLLPIIEAVAHVMRKTPQELIGDELGIPTPFLTWDLFRHSLIHGDLLQVGRYGAKEARWGVFLDGRDHKIEDGKVWIDAKTLYMDFESYLERESAQDDGTVASVEVGVNYVSNPRNGIIEDFKKL